MLPRFFADSGKMEEAVLIGIGCVNASSGNNKLPYLYPTEIIAKMEFGLDLGRWSCNRCKQWIHVLFRW